MPHGITRQFTYLDKVNVFPLKPGVTHILLCSLLENEKSLRKRGKSSAVTYYRIRLDNPQYFLTE